MSNSRCAGPPTSPTSLMFTGIVQAIGEVRAITPRGGDVELLYRAPALSSLDGVAIGDSISVSGCCLTVTRLTADSFAADASLETLKVTTLGRLASRAAREPGEGAARRAAARRPLRHRARRRHRDGGRHGDRCALAAHANSKCPPALARYIARKGSVCIDGVSLTVNDVDANALRRQSDPAHARGDDARRLSRRARK